MTAAQKNTNGTPETFQRYASETAPEARKLYPDYDRWTLNDIETRTVPIVAHSLVSGISDRIEWHDDIPQGIRDQYGAEAPRLFMLAAYKRVATLRNYDEIMIGNLRSAIKTNLKLTEAEAEQLVLDKPMELIMVDGQVIRATPVQAMLHQISNAATNPKLADITKLPEPGEPYFGSLGGIIAFPNSFLDALKRENPGIASRLETLRGKAAYVVEPQDAFFAGVYGQVHGTDNIADWSMTVTDAKLVCPQIPAIQRDLTNMTLRDVRVDDAFYAGSATASGACPTTLGAMTPPAIPSGGQRASSVKVAA